MRYINGSHIVLHVVWGRFKKKKKKKKLIIYSAVLSNRDTFSKAY